MSIIINNYELPNVSVGRTYKEALLNIGTLESELDTLTFVYYDKQKPTFKCGDIATVDETKKYIVGSVRTTLVAKPDKEYMITIVSAELTKVLERFVLSPCSFTNKNDTLLDQVNKVFIKAEVLRLGETPKFVLTSELQTILSNIPSEEFKYDNQVTLREILDDMLGVINYRVVVSDVSSMFNRITISYLNLNKKSQDIKDCEIVGESENESIEYLASEYETIVTNAQSKERRTITEEWSSLKPVEGEIADGNNVRLVTSNPIDEIKKVLLKEKITVGCTLYAVDGQHSPYMTSRDIVAELDMTKYFVEQEVYDAMKKTEQEKHIPYNRGSKNIGVLQSYKKLFWPKTTLWENVNKMAEFYAQYVWSPNHFEIIDGVEYFTQYGSITYLPDEDLIYGVLLFQISYVPYLQLHFKQGKNINLPYKSVMISNQSDRVVDIDRYANGIKALANKLGNKTLEFDIDVNTVNDLLQLGDRIVDGYTLVSREYGVYQDHVNAHYIFYKDYFNVINTKISREKLLYPIPIKNIIDRDVLIKEYIRISTSPLKINNAGCLTDEYAISYFLKTFNNITDEDKPINKMLFFTRIENEIYGMFSIGFIGIPVGSSMLWQFKCYDNYSVGLSTGERMVGGKIVNLNPFVNSNGEFNILDVCLVYANMNSIPFDEQIALGRELPLIPQQYIASYIDTNYTKRSYTDYQSYQIYKDAFEGFGLSYQVEFRANDGEYNSIIIGDFLTKYSNLLFGKNSNIIYIWYSDEEDYTLSDTSKCKGILTDYMPQIVHDETGYFLNCDYPVLQNAKSWALGDENGNLLIGINNPVGTCANKLYFTCCND